MSTLIDPNIAGYLMTLCFCLALVAATHLPDEWDAWQASRPVVAEPAPELVVSSRLQRQADRFTRTNVTLSRYGDRRRRTPVLPTPENSEELIRLTAEAVES
jgi:hypothetical protein